VLPGGRRERVGLRGHGRPLGHGQLGPVGRAAERVHEAFEVAARGDHEPARPLRRLDALGVRHALGGEQRFAGAGGTANLRRLFAESLAADGANVMVHYESPRRAQEASEVIDRLESLGVEAATHQADLTDTAEITRLVDATVDRFGPGTSSSTQPG
jgi:KR domain